MQNVLKYLQDILKHFKDVLKHFLGHFEQVPFLGLFLRTLQIMERFHIVLVFSHLHLSTTVRVVHLCVVKWVFLALGFSSSENQCCIKKVRTAQVSQTIHKGQVIQSERLLKILEAKELKMRSKLWHKLLILAEFVTLINTGNFKMKTKM